MGNDNVISGNHIGVQSNSDAILGVGNLIGLAPNPTDPIPEDIGISAVNVEIGTRNTCT